MDMSIIDLGAEVIIDRSTIRNPYVRLIARALGAPIVSGSSWVFIEKELALQLSLVGSVRSSASRASPPTISTYLPSTLRRRRSYAVKERCTVVTLHSPSHAAFTAQGVARRPAALAVSSTP